MRLLPRHRQTRYERAARKRRNRALAHRRRIERSLGRGRRVPAPVRAVAFAGLFALAAAAGLYRADATLKTVEQWWTGAVVPVQTIAVQGHSRLGAAEVARATGVEPGDVLREVDLAKVATRLEREPWIRRASTARLVGGQLLVLIEERRPRAGVGSDATGWQLVDDDGTPFAPARASQLEELPRLYSERRFASDEPSPILARSLAVAQEIERHEIASLRSPARLLVPEPDSDEGWVLALGEPAARVFLGESDVPGSLARLDTLLRAELAELAGAREIDLRFRDRAVLRGGVASR